MTPNVMTLRWRPVLIIACLMGLLLGAWSIEWAANDPGYLLIGYGRYTLETNLLIGALFILSMVLLSHIFVQLAVWIAGMGSRRRSNGTKKIMKATLSWIEQDWKTAEKLWLQAAERLPQPLLPLVMAADAAQRQGSEERRDNHLQHAISRMPKLKPIIELARARMALEAGQCESCVGLLSGISFSNRKEAARTRIRYMLSAYQQMGDWSELVDMMPDVSRLKLIDEAELASWRVKIVTCWLNQLARRDKVDADDVERVASVLKRLNDDDRQQVALTEACVNVYMRAQDSRRANELIWTVLKNHLDDRLLSIYASLPPESTKTRLERSLQLMKLYEDHAGVLALVGQSYYDAGQTDQAVAMWEQSLRLKFDVHIIRRLAQEYLVRGDHNKALMLWDHGSWERGVATDSALSAGGGGVNLMPGSKTAASEWIKQEKELLDD